MTRQRDSVEVVRTALAASGLDVEVLELPESTRTARAAADAVGCSVAQIAKSIVFHSASGRGVLVIASGSNRIDETRIAAELGEAVAMASPDFVRRVTGFAIGGVPPCAHAERLEVFLDEDLLAHAQVWAAAGTPHALFALDPADLVRLSGAIVTRVR